ncbi:hypothetical protein K1W54_20225 [Micromonospora sp. CPCC 205371]|nr:hypothetical protein [Micromonospora sp. CPCC 205371]
MARHRTAHRGRPEGSPDVAGQGWFDQVAEATLDLGPPERSRVHVSAWATVALVTGVVALAVTLTGLLAPQGLALGVLSLIVGMFALVPVSRPNVTGHSLVVIGLISAVAAIVIGAIALTGEFTWPNSDTNEVDRVHTWLDERWSWLKRW